VHLTKGTVSLQKSNWDSSEGVVTTLWPQRLIHQGSILGGCKRFFRPRSTQCSCSEGCCAPLLRINRRGCAPHHLPTGSYMVKNTWSRTSIYTWCRSKDRIVCGFIVALYCRNGKQFENLVKDSRAMFRNVGCSVFNREWLSSDWGSGSSTADGELRDVGHGHYRAFCTFRMVAVSLHS
jgi:hypothetical protein